MAARCTGNVSHSPGVAVQRRRRARLGRVFRDEEELAASSHLTADIERALDRSQWLIVICSRAATTSPWIAAEIDYFRKRGRADRILAVLIDGEPADAFPPALYSIRQEGAADRRDEPIAADVRPADIGPRRVRKIATLKPAATMLGLTFDDVRQRDQQRLQRRLASLAAVALVTLVVVSALAVLAEVNRREARRLAAIERRATASLIRCLMEFDARRLYLGEGYSSLFTYCTQALHLSESAAYSRIEAARAARRFPSIMNALEDGSLTLTAVRLLAPHLRADTCETVLAAARHKSRSDIERVIASLNPQPAVPSTIRKLPEPRKTAVLPDVVSPASAAETRPTHVAVPSTAARQQQSMVTSLAPERFRVQFTVSRETHDKLRRAQDLLRHAVPSGDPAEIFDRALTVLLEEVERRRCAATRAPRGRRESRHGSRHVPAAVKREVWRRDEGRCAYVGRGGRCTERGFLGYHHVQPYAAGGAATVAKRRVALPRPQHARGAAILRWAGRRCGAGIRRLLRNPRGRVLTD